jgi:hypothetical protein
MMMNLLAEVVGAGTGDSFPTGALLAILGGLSTFIAAVGAVIHGKNQKAVGIKEQKDRTQTEITNNPLAVKMEDHFVTRREFDTFKGELRVDVADIKGIVGQIATKMDERDKRYQDKLDERDIRLSAKIEAVASGAYEARRRIHEKVNDQGERLKSLEDRTPVKRTSGT